MLYNAESELPTAGSKIFFKGYQWHVLKEIYSGVFSLVYLAAVKMLSNSHSWLAKGLANKMGELRDVSDMHKLYAMKVEKQRECERPVLKLDVAVLSRMQSSIGFPAMLVAGRTNTFKFCVMQLVGPDLRSLMWSMPEKKFSPSTAFRVALQTLDRLEKLHDAGYLNRDIKAQNFAVGIGRESSVIYMLDFGLTRKFRAVDGTRLKRRGSGPCVGTFPYTPLASSALKDQAPKDDIEGWFYMIVEIFLGYLPWHSSKNNFDYGLTREWKQFVRGAYRKELLAALPLEFAPIFDSIINTRFEERPRYQFVQQMLYSSAARQNVNLTVSYDWQVVPALLTLTKRVTEHRHERLLSTSSGSARADNHEVFVDDPI